MQTTLKVTGMNCGACVNHVTQALKEVLGVKSAQVDLASGQATVEHDASATPQALVAAVDEAGYEAQAA